MAVRYFNEGMGRSSQLPFFSDWYSSLTPEEQEFYQGWKFVVFDFRYQTKSNKGWFMDTLKFTTFLFKSHPFVKMMGEDDFHINLRNQALCVEVDASQEWGYKFCLVEVPYCEWEPGEEHSLGVVCKGTFLVEEKVIINNIPNNVPSTNRTTRKKKAPYSPRG